MAGTGQRRPIKFSRNFQEYDQSAPSQFTWFCYMCNKGFKSSSGYSIHKKIYHTVRPDFPKCPVCGKQFASASRLMRHQLSHSSSKAFTCKRCQKSYKYASSLKSHAYQPEQDTSTEQEVTESVAVPMSCVICGFRAPNQDGDAFGEHVRKHGYATYCDVCGFSMGLQEQGTFSCPECNGSFSSMEALLEHRRTVHKSSYHVMCEECGKVFRSTSGYRNHQKIRHSSDSNVPFCKICGKKFSSSSRLFEHRKKHSDQTYYACQKCGKSFKHARSVKRHDIVCKQ
uniref:C2H2-type domain-containing protein n=1 Tax=Magallana gigas TaxID=29159 RepID=A0A8W8N7R3_MAGGI